MNQHKFVPASTTNFDPDCLVCEGKDRDAIHSANREPDTSKGITYTNPRMSAVIENWPSGRHRVTARFEIEQDAKRGERAVRVTDGAPKKLTYAKMARIVDGSDGRTYIAELTEYGFISIMRGDMKFQHESIPTNDPRYAAALEIFA